VRAGTSQTLASPASEVTDALVDLYAALACGASA